MFEWNEGLRVGERVAWWADKHGLGVASDHPDAVRRQGLIDYVLQHPLFPSTVVAYSVKCESITGPYIVMLRPDHGHQPTRDHT
ncbi:hypothetical protein AB0H76_26240 [Nocardia sp. NPDC050712]|uniref:hypothetical protein n=1 Tax=Nocardia sp. NPDC050712 TaxID=3155518 RepID=UPI0033BFC8B8